MSRWPSRAIAGALAGLALTLVLAAPTRAEEDPAAVPPAEPSTDATLSALTLAPAPSKNPLAATLDMKGFSPVTPVSTRMVQSPRRAGSGRCVKR